MRTRAKARDYMLSRNVRALARVCTYLWPTTVSRFNNVANFRGFLIFPGKCNYSSTTLIDWPDDPMLVSASQEEIHRIRYQNDELVD